MMSPYQISQDVVVALCILALFNNLEDKVSGEIESKMPGIHNHTFCLCVDVCVHNGERDFDSVSAVCLLQCTIFDLVQDRKKAGFNKSDSRN